MKRFWTIQITQDTGVMKRVVVEFTPDAPKRSNTNLFSEIVEKYPTSYPSSVSQKSTNACGRVTR